MNRQLSKIYEVEKSIQWARAFQQTIDLLAGNDVIDPITRNITKSVNRFHWLPACMQALLFCRYSELKSISLEDVLNCKTITIIQSKTRSKRQIENHLLLYNSEHYNLDPSAKIFHTNYDSYRNELKRVIPGRVHQILEYNSDVTHVFRHLHASWLAFKGYSIDEIKESFQHESVQTTRSYVHEGLFSTNPKQNP